MNDVANIRMEMRTDILETSLAIEGMLSVFLAGLLGIKIDPDTTNSFSNKSSALSFANKIHLLIDIGALDKEMKLKYFTFMEIRNQFMHNIKIRSYEHFFTEYLSDKKKYVLSHYKTDKKIPLESHLELATQILARDVLKITYDLFEKVDKKMKDDFVKKTQLKIYDDLRTATIEDKKFVIRNYKEGTKIFTEEDVSKIISSYLKHIADKTMRNIK